MTRVGVIGTGWVAQNRHIPALRSISGVELVGVYDRDFVRATEVARRLGIGVVARDRQGLLDLGLDAVSIATSPWSHAEHAVAALEAGLHVFVEKPMAMDQQEAASMVAAAEASGKVLTVSHNFSFSRASRRARRSLGPSPDLLFAAAVQLSSDRRRLPVWYARLPGGLMFDEVPHLLYTLLGWCGPLSLSSARASWRPDGHPAVVEASFSGAVPAQATMVFGAPLSEWHVTLVGRRRVVDLDLFRDIAISVDSDHHHRALDIGVTSARVIVDHTVGFASSGYNMVRGRLQWGHDELISAFIGAARGERSNPVPPGESLEVVCLADALLLAIEARRHLPVPPGVNE